MLTVRLMNEFLHGPLWVLDEDGISFSGKALPIVEDDPETQKLNEQIDAMFDGYYAFDSHDCACWFDARRELSEADCMLDLAWCLFARVCELNDGSFKVEDQLIPDLERKVDLFKRQVKPPEEIKSFYEGNCHYPLWAKFSLNPGARRGARFRTKDDQLLEFWIQDGTDLPEKFYLSTDDDNVTSRQGKLPVPNDSNRLVYLGFSDDVPCEKISVTLYEDGALIGLSPTEPSEWRRAGDVYFGYDPAVNLLAIAMLNIGEEKMSEIRNWLKS